MFAWEVGVESLRHSHHRNQEQEEPKSPLSTDDKIRRGKIDRAYWTFQLLALIYNLEHGIIPAALPQIRHYYHTSAFFEASTQCASVFGTQLGVCLITTYKVPLNKLLALLSVFFIGVCSVGTRLIPLGESGDRQGIPSQLFIWRFAAGLSASYCINLIPRWINIVYPEDGSIRQAHFQTFGIVGTIAGYALALTSPAETPILSDAWSVPFRNAREQLGTTTLGSNVLWLFSQLSEPLDFRRAFLWSGTLAFAGAILAAITLDSACLFMPSTPRPPLDVPSVEAIVHEASPADFTSRSLLAASASPPGCLLCVPLTHQAQAIIRRSTTRQDLKELSKLVEFVGLVLCVWINTTTAQAVNFWLFTSYTIGMGTSTATASLGVGLVFVLGTVTGLYLATSLQKYINRESRAVNSIVVPPELLQTVVILSACSSLLGATIFFATGFWSTTMIFMFAVIFGSAIIPIAQSAIGLCTPPHLHETAYGLHQFAFQSTWFCGPLLPVFIGWISGRRVETFGLRAVVVFPTLAVSLIWRAWEHRKRSLYETDPTRLETELAPLMSGA